MWLEPFLHFSIATTIISMFCWMFWQHKSQSWVLFIWKLFVGSWSLVWVVPQSLLGLLLFLPRLHNEDTNTLLLTIQAIIETKCLSYSLQFCTLWRLDPHVASVLTISLFVVFLIVSVTLSPDICICTTSLWESEINTKSSAYSYISVATSAKHASDFINNLYVWCWFS